MTKYTEQDKEEITALLVGRKVVKVAEDLVQLDDGRLLRFEGHDGGCACSAGCYDLTELNGVDNVITGVEFEDSPADDYGNGDGTYKIFVFADNQRINLATFEGDEGNGYYGTGYSIEILDED